MSERLDEQLFLNKYRLDRVLGCEVRPEDEFEWTPPKARGLVGHKAIELSVMRRDDPSPLDLVDDRVIRVLDLVFVHKDRDGALRFVTPDELAERGAAELLAFVGARSGLIGDDDLDSIGEVLSPDCIGCVTIYENTWAAALGAAVRQGGGQLVSGGRIPVQAFLAALDQPLNAA